MIEPRTQNPANRSMLNVQRSTKDSELQTKRPLTRYSLLGAYFLLLTSSLAMGVSWNLGDLLKAYLRDNYPWAEIEVNDVRWSGSLPKEPPERILLDRGPIGKAVFSLEFRTGERIAVNANVKAMDWVLISRNSFKNGHVLQKDDVYLSLMDVTRMPRNVVTNLEAAIGKTLTRSIPANMPVVEGSVGDAPSVKKGQRVTLLFESSGFKITTAGETKENGYVGRQIKVVNLASKKEVRGILLDGKTVKVEF